MRKNQRCAYLFEQALSEVLETPPVPRWNLGNLKYARKGENCQRIQGPHRRSGGMVGWNKEINSRNTRRSGDVQEQSVDAVTKAIRPNGEGAGTDSGKQGLGTPVRRTGILGTRDHKSHSAKRLDCRAVVESQGTAVLLRP
jgi:hypothetical protein